MSLSVCRPKQIAEAVAWVKKNNHAYVAGGQSWLAQVRLAVSDSKPLGLVSVLGMDELLTIKKSPIRLFEQALSSSNEDRSFQRVDRQANGGNENLVSTQNYGQCSGVNDEQANSDQSLLWIGAGVSLFNMASHVEVKRHLPGVVDLIQQIPDPSVVNQATLGGTLVLSDPRSSLAAACVAMDVWVKTHRQCLPLRDCLSASGQFILPPDELIVSVGFPLDSNMVYSGCLNVSQGWPLIGVVLSRSVHQDLTCVVVGSDGCLQANKALAAMLETSAWDSGLDSLVVAFKDDVWNKSSEKRVKFLEHLALARYALAKQKSIS